VNKKYEKNRLQISRFTDAFSINNKPLSKISEQFFICYCAKLLSESGLICFSDFSIFYVFADAFFQGIKREAAGHWP
jgi:hypothetical protein